ncbi:MAG: hypothetical protein AVDCRST_MAG67-2197 [uncultured Solirubrobacteraceae bacterium]|uniref:Uncharacterized protein n=1 Tax=uncultured Solirubrobacteraceae bacterium TaxID=1162706 RepID=A0A6J4SAR1_9ACTN|nr:MAG: hypothetical protein AVDCRST_MAG67-2197 [uncultured Solirubrobacteraceae bacterium]
MTESGETEPLSGMPEDEQDQDLPLGVPADEDDEVDRERPGFPEGDIDTAG